MNELDAKDCPIDTKVKNYVNDLPMDMDQMEQIKQTISIFNDTYDLNPNYEQDLLAIIVDAVQCRFCSVCKKQVDCNLYDDCESIFDTYKNSPLCEPCHKKVFESLERKCVLCGSKIRGCSC